KSHELFRSKLLPTERAAYLKRIEAGEILRIDAELGASKGATVWTDMTAIGKRSRDGKLTGLISVNRDITERAQIEGQRAQLLVREQTARAEVERASRLKDDFLAVLSHELRTPLNAVLGYAHLLGSGVLTPERTAHALNAIQRNAQAQARLVESLLDLSRIMAGTLELDLERVDLARLVDAAVDVIRPDADGAGVLLD